MSGASSCAYGERDEPTTRRAPRYNTHGPELSSEIEAAVTALRARYGALVDSGPMIYVGFSQGAGLGPGVVMRSPSRFSRANMIEGGSGGWSPLGFAKNGGQRVLFACGQAGCARSGQVVATQLERAHVASQVAYAPGAGHTYGGDVAAAIKSRWAWLVQGDPRWATSP